MTFLFLKQISFLYCVSATHVDFCNFLSFCKYFKLNDLFW